MIKGNEDNKNFELLLREQIALKLVELRQKKGITQKELADITDINIDRIERMRSNTTVKTIYRLCEFFNISLEEFFRGIDITKSK